MAYRDQIDSISQLDLSTLKLSEIRWMYGTFRPFSSGSGRDKIHWSRSGVQTQIGDVKESLWYEVVEHLAKRDGEQWLVEELFAWEKEHNYAKQNPNKLRQDALELYSNRNFDNPQWIHYIPFNRRHRPLVLESAHLVTVINDCCKLPGETTQEQIDRSFEKKIYCPHCGRWSEFTIVDTLTIPPWENESE